MSPFVPGLLVGYALGVASMCGLVGLYLLHRPRYVAPTLRRKNRDRLPEVRHEPPPMPVCKAVREDGGVNYQWLGVTGSEQE